MAEASPDRQQDRPVKRSLSGELSAADRETVTPPAKKLCVSPGSSSTGSAPKFYRLDFLWGKSEKKEAQRPPAVGEPAQELVSLEQEEEQARAAQTDARAVVLRRNKGGRPKGRKGKTVVPGVRKKKAEPTARAKLQLARELELLKRQPEMSRQAARMKMQGKYKVSDALVRRLEKAGERERLEAFCAKRQMGVQTRQRKGSHLRKNKVASQSQGKRIAKPGQTLGKTDHCRVVWQQTAMWAQREEQCGHLLSQTDLMRDYQHRLTLAEESGEQRKRKAGEAWTDQEERQLAAWKKKRQTLANNKKMRAKDGDKLAARAGLRARMCQQTQNISSEEAAERMLVGWRLYDYALWRASQAEVQPDFPVREPAQWVVQYRTHGSDLQRPDSCMASTQPRQAFDQHSQARAGLAGEQSQESQQKSEGSSGGSSTGTATAAAGAGRGGRGRNRAGSRAEAGSQASANSTLLSRNCTKMESQLHSPPGHQPVFSAGGRASGPSQTVHLSGLRTALQAGEHLRGRQVGGDREVRLRWPGDSEGGRGESASRPDENLEEAQVKETRLVPDRQAASVESAFSSCRLRSLLLAAKVGGRRGSTSSGPN